MLVLLFSLHQKVGISYKYYDVQRLLYAILLYAVGYLNCLLLRSESHFV